jgi:uncharacterized small protein (DUF1192 family)
VKKKPNRRTPEERAAHQVNREELEARIALLTDELEAAGSAYAQVDRAHQLDYARRRIDAELAAKRKPAQPP